MRNKFSMGSASSKEPVVLQSYLNIFNVRQITLVGALDTSILSFNIPVKAEADPDFIDKVFYLQNCVTVNC